MVTVSIAVCCWNPHFGYELGEFVGEADTALYAAKHLGRNRVEMATFAVQAAIPENHRPA
jgi:PleD family two-component response regulator